MKKDKGTIHAATRLLSDLVKIKEISVSRVADVAGVIEAAFHLYDREWPGKDIENWNYPFDQIKKLTIIRDLRGVRSESINLIGCFKGPESWNILLREAIVYAYSH